MIRIRVPGGVCTPAQWIGIDRLSDQFADGTLKLTTRQAFQLHGVLKGNLKQTMKEINNTLLDTLAACGDVNRNVMSPANPFESSLHGEALTLAREIHDHLTPRTTAYAEIWLDGEKTAVGEEKTEPIYGKTYLPRKFKIAVALPPRNERRRLLQRPWLRGDCREWPDCRIQRAGRRRPRNDAWQNDYFPRVADDIGFCLPDQAVRVAEEVVKIQRISGIVRTGATPV